MATQFAAWNPDQPSRRRWLRYPAPVVLDVTVLRSGVPETMPGRCVDVSMGGIAAVLAGELSPGESVGVEMHLPLAEVPFRARALVRHHNQLRCGMEFVGLSDDQQAAIRNSTEKPRTKKERQPDIQSKLPPEVKNSSPVSPGDEDSGQRSPSSKQRRREWLFLLLSALILLAVLWWRWNRGWEDLESDLRKNDTILRPEANEAGHTSRRSRLPRSRAPEQFAGSGGARCDRGTRWIGSACASAERSRCAGAIGYGCAPLVAIRAISRERPGCSGGNHGCRRVQTISVRDTVMTATPHTRRLRIVLSTKMPLIAKETTATRAAISMKAGLK
jgi:hypothetical protein